MEHVDIKTDSSQQFDSSLSFLSDQSRNKMMPTFPKYEHFVNHDSRKFSKSGTKLAKTLKPKKRVSYDKPKGTKKHSRTHSRTHSRGRSKTKEFFGASSQLKDSSKFGTIKRSSLGEYSSSSEIDSRDGRFKVKKYYKEEIEFDNKKDFESF